MYPCSAIACSKGGDKFNFSNDMVYLYFVCADKSQGINDIRKLSAVIRLYVVPKNKLNIDFIKFLLLSKHNRLLLIYYSLF